MIIIDLTKPHHVVLLYVLMHAAIRRAIEGGME